MLQNTFIGRTPQLCSLCTHSQKLEVKSNIVKSSFFCYSLSYSLLTKYCEIMFIYKVALYNLIKHLDFFFIFLFDLIGERSGNNRFLVMFLEIPLDVQFHFFTSLLLLHILKILVCIINLLINE